MTSKKNSIDNLNPSNKEDTLNKSATSVYNEKELKYLDKYLPLVHNAFDVKLFFIY